MLLALYFHLTPSPQRPFFLPLFSLSAFWKQEQDRKKCIKFCSLFLNNLEEISGFLFFSTFLLLCVLQLHFIPEITGSHLFPNSPGKSWGSWMEHIRLADSGGVIPLPFQGERGVFTPQTLYQTSKTLAQPVGFGEAAPRAFHLGTGTRQDPMTQSNKIQR